MFRVLTCLTTEHDLRLVVIAGMICFLASFTAIDLFGRARALAGRERAVWLLAAGAATGCGIWATHFVAILAGQHPGDRVPVLLSRGADAFTRTVALADRPTGVADR